MRQKRAKDKRINARKKAHGRQTRQRARKPAQKRQNTKAGNKAAGRRTCGKPHAQPPGGGTSLHPGAASQTGQTAAAKAPHTQAHGRQTAGSAGQTKPDTKAAGCPQARNKAAAHRQKNAGAPGAKVLTTAAGFAKTAAPAGGAAHWTQKKPLRTAKFAFALLPARRGHVNQDRQKTLRCFGWHGLLLLRIAHSAAQRRTKGGAAPFYPLQAF